MRLFEFVQCGRRGLLMNGADDGCDNVPSAVAQQHRTDETVQLNQVSRGSNGREKRRRSLLITTGWRPSLGAISEDDAALKSKVSSDRHQSVRQAKTPTMPKAGKVAGGQSRRVEGEDLRFFAVPAFAPTSFAF